MQGCPWTACIVSRDILSMFEYRRNELLVRDLPQLNLFSFCTFWVVSEDLRRIPKRKWAFQLFILFTYMYLGFSMCMLSMSYRLNIYFPSWDCHVILLIIRVFVTKISSSKKGWSKFAGEVCILIVRRNLCFDRCVWKSDQQLNFTGVKTTKSLCFPRMVSVFTPLIFFCFK